MRTKDSFDFSNIDWSKINREKAEFIYNEAIARLDSIHKNIEGITKKALRMLSFSVPVLTALAGYFVLQWGNLSIPLLATSICAALFLFSIFVLLWLILLPRGLNSAQGEPAAYFTNAFYLNSMDDILKGNIQTLQQCINQDMAILNFRGNLLRAAVVLFPVFPFFTVIVWALVSAFTNC